MLDHRWLLLGFIAVAADCGGHTSSNPTGDTSGASTTGSPGAGGGTGSAGSTGSGTGAGGSAGGCATGVDGATLAGNWHAVGTSIGKPSVEFDISIDAQHVTIQNARGSFVAERNANGFTVTYTDDGSVTPKRLAASQQFAGSAALGVVPIDLSGSWTFRNILGPTDSGDHFGCDATLAARSLSGVCSDTHLPSWTRPYDPGPGMATGTKIADGASIFGDLSGTWSVPLRTATCTFEFQGTTFSSICGKLGAMRITFCGSMASGSTTSGIEFSAQRL
jgi:hypothetical protein